MSHPGSPLFGHDYRCFSLDQVAARLSALANAQSGTLALELHTASLCCRDACTRWEDLRQSLRDYRLERSQLTSWFDAQIEQLEQEALGLPPSEDLSSLRPDAEGHYAWDRWQSQALAAGLSEDLATLGRAVMREAAQHDWNCDLKAECGWLDAGQAMLAQALADGPGTEERWHDLLQTDGERGRWSEEGQWLPWERS